MMDRERETAHLAKANADIVAGERRISALLIRIEHLRAEGHDTAAPEAFLATLEGTLEQWMVHRGEIIRVIAAIDRGRAQRRPATAPDNETGGGRRAQDDEPKTISGLCREG